MFTTDYFLFIFFSFLLALPADVVLPTAPVACECKEHVEVKMVDKVFPMRVDVLESLIFGPNPSVSRRMHKVRMNQDINEVVTAQLEGFPSQWSKMTINYKLPIKNPLCTFRLLPNANCFYC